MNIDQLINAHRDDDLDKQRITWNRSMWEKVWSDEDLPGHGTLDLIDAELGQHGTIPRSWLRGLAGGDPVTFLVATTIWGYGSFGRGVKALKAMLGCGDVAGIASDIIRSSRQDAASGFRSLFTGGKPRIPWLGIAYGTKVVHFAGYDDADPRPLILDKRVFLGAQALGIDCIPDPTRYTTGDEYASYCAWAGEIARRNEVEPALVEYVLFLHGGEVRRARRSGQQP